jgi:predicted CXXCH cytochrome family protein
VGLRGFNHPVDVPAAEASALPLQAGRMTCLTCHDEGSPQRHARAAERGDDMLREGLTPAALCVRCHDPRSATRYDLHGAALRRAHLLWAEPGWGRPATQGGAGGAAGGTASAECLGCHDGMGAVEARYTSGTPAWADAHPVGVEYRAQRGSLRPLHALDRTLVLPGGRVECASCHSLYSREPDLLVMSNQRSALCLACHAF